jgi:hypothetical protein
MVVCSADPNYTYTGDDKFLTSILEFVDKHSPQSDLPFFHITIAENFIKYIMPKEKLIPQHCTKFDEKLTYLGLAQRG